MATALCIDSEETIKHQADCLIEWLRTNGFGDLVESILVSGTTFNPVPENYLSYITMNLNKITRPHISLAAKVIPSLSVMVVWDVARRIRYKGSMDFRITKEGLWTANPCRQALRCVYLRFNNGRDSGRVEDKAMVVGFDNAEAFFSHPHAYLALNPDDIEFGALSVKRQNAIRDMMGSGLEGVSVGRKRYSTSFFARNAGFRERVLRAYGNRCAVCRLDEVRALEAAHRRGFEVRAGNYFDTTQGVCLCANHHRMYDSNLFDIDFDSCHLTDVIEEVRGQEWYRLFESRYNASILRA